ncbi:hypothetical protein F5X99DRAFT_430192 [Biscogniauxia marginata]|nr:hypothetical protein F5X99DRAFT_430192 [Biscogniauxia marginata]
MCPHDAKTAAIIGARLIRNAIEKNDKRHVPGRPTLKTDGIELSTPLEHHHLLDTYYHGQIKEAIWKSLKKHLCRASWYTVPPRYDFHTVYADVNQNRQTGRWEIVSKPRVSFGNFPTTVPVVACHISYPALLFPCDVVKGGVNLNINLSATGACDEEARLEAPILQFFKIEFIAGGTTFHASEPEVIWLPEGGAAWTGYYSHQFQRLREWHERERAPVTPKLPFGLGFSDPGVFGP